MDNLLTADALISLLILSLMEIVLGIDNIVFISVVTSRLPEKDQPSARRIRCAACGLMLSWCAGAARLVERRRCWQERRGGRSRMPVAAE